MCNHLFVSLCVHSYGIELIMSIIHSTGHIIGIQWEFSAKDYSLCYLERHLFDTIITETQQMKHQIGRSPLDSVDPFTRTRLPWKETGQSIINGTDLEWGLSNNPTSPIIGNDKVAKDCCSTRCFLRYRLDYITIITLFLPAFVTAFQRGMWESLHPSELHWLPGVDHHFQPPPNLAHLN